MFQRMLLYVHYYIVLCFSKIRLGYKLLFKIIKLLVIAQNFPFLNF